MEQSLYGKLNKLVDLTAPKTVTQDEGLQIQVDGVTTYLSLNREKLVQFKLISDRLPLQYQLLGYNNETRQFDIPLGDTITLSGSSTGGNAQLTGAIIGGQHIDAYISAAGNLVLDKIPVSALIQTDYYTAPDGSLQYYESVIDGNG